MDTDVIRSWGPVTRKDAARAKVTNIDEFIEAGTDEARATLKELRRVIRSAAPKATEAISYGIPVFKHEGLLVGFSAYKDHYSFFVMGTSVMHAFKNELKSYDTSKGTIRFPLDRPLPFALVRKMVKARVRENESRFREKAARKQKATTRKNRRTS